VSPNPYLDGQLEDEGPAPGERRCALAVAALVLGSVLLRSGAEGLIRRDNQGVVGLCCLGLLAILFRDALSEPPSMPFLRSGGWLPPAAIGWAGWVVLGLSASAEGLSWVAE
jgi:hypothetical protein